MRFHGLVLVAAVAALSACGGGDNAGTDTTATAGAGTAATPAAGTATGTAAPVTGTVHEVKMIGDEKGYRFDPVDITIKAGDGIKWVMVSGGPHNVQFENIAADAKAQFVANMPNQLSELSSPMLINPNETYEMSFGNVKPGKYSYLCTPHLANNMRGTVTVQ
jgi:plastocyanin